jgi:hypothetical protein
MEYKYTSQQRYSQKIRDKGNNIKTDRLESGFGGGFYTYLMMRN